MKKLSVFLAILFFGAPAYAVVGCVPLQTTTTCTSTITNYLNKGEWAATCNGVQVSGVGICVSTSASAAGSAGTSYNVSATGANNRYCKCRMTQPVGSRWITPSHCSDNTCYSVGGWSAGQCKKYCAYACAGSIIGYFYTDDKFNPAMFNTMDD